MTQLTMATTGAGMAAVVGLPPCGGWTDPVATDPERDETLFTRQAQASEERFGVIDDDTDEDVTAAVAEASEVREL